MTLNRVHKKGKRGMALVMVLGVLAVSSLLVLHAMSVCEVIARDGYVSVRRSELRYEAESGADQSFWMHLTDRRLYSNRTLGATNESRADSDFEPWMADRRGHALFDTNCQAYIDCVEKSIILTSSTTFKTGMDVEDADLQERITNFLSVLSDYTDSDTETRLNGKDEAEYADEGLYHMPRNGSIQFKEELYWLDGWQEAVMGEVTMIPPQGKTLSSTTKPSFFSASASEIKRLLDIEDETVETILEARNQWVNDGVELSESLDADLIVNLKSSFSFTESDVARYVVSSATPVGDVRVLYEVVRGSNLSATSIYADTASESFSIWSRLVQ